MTNAIWSSEPVPEEWDGRLIYVRHPKRPGEPWVYYIDGDVWRRGQRILHPFEQPIALNCDAAIVADKTYTGEFVRDNILGHMQKWKAEVERLRENIFLRDSRCENIARAFRALLGKRTSPEEVARVIDSQETEIERLREVVRDLTDRGRVRPGSDWHEDMGDVLWTDVPIDEPPYCGSPLDRDFPWSSTPIAKLFFVLLPPVFTGDFQAAEAALGGEGK